MIRGQIRSSPMLTPWLWLRIQQIINVLLVQLGKHQNIRDFKHTFSVCKPMYCILRVWVWEPLPVQMWLSAVGNPGHQATRTPPLSAETRLSEQDVSLTNIVCCPIIRTLNGFYIQTWQSTIVWRDEIYNVMKTVVSACIIPADLHRVQPLNRPA